MFVFKIKDGWGLTEEHGLGTLSGQRGEVEGKTYLVAQKNTPRDQLFNFFRLDKHRQL